MTSLNQALEQVGLFALAGRHCTPGPNTGRKDMLGSAQPYGAAASAGCSAGASQPLAGLQPSAEHTWCIKLCARATPAQAVETALDRSFDIKANVSFAFSFHLAYQLLLCPRIEPHPCTRCSLVCIPSCMVGFAGSVAARLLPSCAQLVPQLLTVRVPCLCSSTPSSPSPA